MLEEKIVELLKDADPKVIRVILRVMMIEQSKLHQEKPRGLNLEIRQIVEEEVKKA